MTNRYNLGIAWSWEHDSNSVYRLEEIFHAYRLTTYRVERHNLDETLGKLKKGTLHFDFFLDRASDSEKEFEPLARFIEKSKTRVINNYTEVRRAMDKATMHLEFIAHGLHTPYTIIISPYNTKKEIELSLSDLAHLGRPFIIKPANTTGGGSGVVLGAETLRDVLQARQHYKGDKYLLQEKITPRWLDGRRAWFRCFYVFGRVIPCWWNDLTHIYDVLTETDEHLYKLSRLRKTMRQIREVCKVDFFSSEIALIEDRRLIVVDYVNEMCDLRPKSKYYDGVPDEIIEKIVSRMMHYIKSKV
jgi:hypothetical protein